MVAQALGAADLPIHTAAVCVYHELVPTAVEALRGTALNDRWLPGILAGETVAALAASARATRIIPWP